MNDNYCKTLYNEAQRRIEDLQRDMRVYFLERSNLLSVVSELKKENERLKKENDGLKKKNAVIEII